MASWRSWHFLVPSFARFDAALSRVDNASGLTLSGPSFFLPNHIATLLNLNRSKGLLAATVRLRRGTPKLNQRNDVQQYRQRHQECWNEYQRKR
jgi:hypothetical protein